MEMLAALCNKLSFYQAAPRQDDGIFAFFDEYILLNQKMTRRHILFKCNTSYTKIMTLRGRFLKVLRNRAAI